jgi:tetratricopeptide (TPR) repeat protein
LNIPKAFWIALAIFEIAFGAAIFVATRSYYRSQSDIDSFASLDIQSLNFPSTEIAPAPPIDLERPRTPQELAELADTHFANRQYEAAAALYEQLLNQNRSNVDLLNNLALTLHYVGRSDEALRRLEQGIAMDATHQRIRLTRGFVLSQTGRLNEAVGALNAAIQLNDTSQVADSARQMLADIAQR